MFGIFATLRLARLRRGLPEAAAAQPAPFAPALTVDLPLPLHRRHRQERAGPALRLAAGRDGGPDARLRPDPRRDDGHGRRLHGRPLQRALPARARGDARRRRRSAPSRRSSRRRSRVAQNDIKKVLAYSTVSQLGYMFLACGVGAFVGGHVPRHDARLLQGLPLPRLRLGHPRDGRRAGHAEDGRPEVEAARSPTGRSSIATLAIAGIPPLAGFFSKDAILAGAFEHGRLRSLFGVGLFTAGLTAFYMFRLVSLTFFGQLPRHARAGAPPPRVAARR